MRSRLSHGNYWPVSCLCIPDEFMNMFAILEFTCLCVCDDYNLLRAIGCEQQDSSHSRRSLSLLCFARPFTAENDLVSQNCRLNVPTVFETWLCRAGIKSPSIDWVRVSVSGYLWVVTTMSKLVGMPRTTDWYVSALGFIVTTRYVCQVFMPLQVSVLPS